MRWTRPGSHGASGDLWALGEHRLLCGDAVAHENFLKLMDGETAHMVFTDSPYNVDYTGGTEKKLKIENDNLNNQKFIYKGAM